ncbi:uncharacterized protein [Triticum aestivum]|uniref:uncharacterized protein isoform X3 n=1 Tax=Triticum aestivum TaxID=4565 RepID=UPI001ABBEA53|nr:uncharacterized protein LOC109785321 isoform X5 [Aegilops tauschii subsp. strangulata]XP_044329683.1 uncharacterized protein LOC123051015 isoform X3 [Triticum aestivum]
MQRAAALLCRFLEIPDELQRRLEKRRANHWQWNTICSFYPDELQRRLEKRRVNHLQRNTIQALFILVSDDENHNSILLQ